MLLLLNSVYGLTISSMILHYLAVSKKKTVFLSNQNRTCR